MPNIIAESFSKYTGTITNFENFHNQVINMPRPTFSEIPKIIKLLKSLAEYILLIDKDVLQQSMQAKDVYEHIYNNYKCGRLPEKNRNSFFENTYLNHSENFDDIYDTYGRRFRHYTELLAFFDIFKDIENRHNQFDIDALYELVLTPEDCLFDVFRNKILDLNIKTNSYICRMRGIVISDTANYRPARAIIQYLNSIERNATSFEISVLFGRVDDMQDEKDILIRALNIGKVLPSTMEQQIDCFFGSMGWKNQRKERFQYSPSQQPYFKFKTFLILMDTFGLISYSDSVIKLTEYSKSLVKDDIPIEMLDLEKLLMRIDDDNEDSNKLQDIILRKRTATITEAIQSDGLLVEKLNLRNIRNPIIKNNKRIRSRLIMELAKIKADYMDEVTKTPTFEGKNGKNYVEAHHIIEFNGDNGPDITDNLICLGPQNHMCIHRGSERAVSDFYNTCKTRGVITFERFKNICVKYKCLTKEHVKILLAKGLISSIDADELLVLIDTNGVDPVFIASLKTPAATSNLI